MFCFSGLNDWFINGYLIQVRPMRLTLEFWPELLGKRPSLSTGVVSKKSAWTSNGYLCHHLGKLSWKWSQNREKKTEQTQKIKEISWCHCLNTLIQMHLKTILSLDFPLYDPIKTFFYLFVWLGGISCGVQDLLIEAGGWGGRADLLGAAWPVGCSSLIRDRNWASCIWSAES